MLAVGRVGPAFLPEFYDGGGLQIGAVHGALWPGNARCNIADHDRSAGRSRRWRYILANGKTFDGKHLQCRVSFSPEGETGQPTTIMSAYGRLFRRPLNREVLPLDPGRGYDRGLFLLNLPQEATRLMGMMSFAPSAR